MPTRDRVLVIGGGASGCAAAIACRRVGRKVTVVERSRVGRGVAYGTSDPTHLLNVPAARMSADAGDPLGFVRWWKRRDPDACEAGFAPRLAFGSYLEEAVAESGAEIVAGSAVDLAVGPKGVVVTLAGGTTLEGGDAVLALGHAPQRSPCPVAPGAVASGAYRDDPWTSAPAQVQPEASVALIGTGLTAIDVVLSLEAAGHRGPVVAISRHGLWPQPHRVAGHPPDPAALLDTASWPRTARGYLRGLREAIAGSTEDWRESVNRLRPVTQRLWAELPVEERGRFLARLRAFWDVHRHRMAPVVAERMATIGRSGRLGTLRGRALAVSESGVSVGHGGATTRVAADLVINCTGPGSDAIGTIPLLAQLRDRGLVRADPLGLGIDAAADGQVLDRHGRRQERIAAIGPLLRGVLWESTAVPEIREQAAALAARLDRQVAAVNA
jgi:uncharacterized NAD(P)/FAD-binding protein YdhS